MTGERTLAQGAAAAGADGPRDWAPAAGLRPGKAGAEPAQGEPGQARHSPEGTLPDLGELLVLGDLVAEGALDHVILLGHGGRAVATAPRPARSAT